MIKTINISICDLCKKEKDTQKISVPVYRTFDSNDGKLFYSEKRFEQAKLDLCRDCLEKITKIHSIGVCCEEYIAEDV